MNTNQSLLFLTAVLKHPNRIPDRGFHGSQLPTTGYNNLLNPDIKSHWLISPGKTDLRQQNKKILRTYLSPFACENVSILLNIRVMGQLINELATSPNTKY